MKFLSIEEFAKECIGPKLIALSGRDDEENTLYAIKLCRYLYDEGDSKILFLHIKILVLV